MEFWGVEVKSGEPLTVEPEDGMVIHLSQACMGETKSKGNESVFLTVKIDDKKFVLGNLSLEKFPQLAFDLVFEKEFEISHNWKNGSIHLCGYQTFVGDEEGEDFDEFDDSEEEEEDLVPSNAAVQNGKVAEKVEQAKPSVAKGIAAKPQTSEKPKVKVVEPSKAEEDEDSDESESDDEDDSEDGSDEDMLGGDDSDEDDDSDEETPKKPESGKKRANEAAAKTPVSAKKAKTASPKSDGKKAGGHVATPHPAKKAGKAPATPAAATADKSKPQTPKSGGSIACKSCSKTFGSDKALESHTKAKHG